LIFLGTTDETKNFDNALQQLQTISEC
jgi:hypothetical protein